MKDRAKIQLFLDEIKGRGKARHNVIPGEVAYERGPAHHYQPWENLIHTQLSQQIIEKPLCKSTDKYLAIWRI